MAQLPTLVPVPTEEQIIQRTQQVFNKRPCYLQVQICQQILKRKKNVLLMAATGFGKTLTFFMPLLFVQNGHIIIVTALNILGTQIVKQLSSVGISAVAVSAETFSADLLPNIQKGCYKAIVVNPEILLQSKGIFEKLWESKSFTSRLISMIFDEAHCITRWGSFRPEYRDLGRLRIFLPNTPFLAASATLSPKVIKDVSEILQFKTSNTKEYLRSNDRPNVFLAVRPLTSPAKSFKDLAFLVPKGGEIKPPKFLVFFDNIKEAEGGCKYLRSRLPPEKRHLIKWYHASMSESYRQEELQAFIDGDRWGFCVTDSFGMGIDLSSIIIIVQWRATCNMDTLMQRFGRAARDPDLEGYGLLLAEPHWFDNERERIKEAREKRNNNKRKRIANSDAQNNPPKRRAVPDINSTSTPTPIATTSSTDQDLSQVDHDFESGEIADDDNGDVVEIVETNRDESPEQRRQRYLEYEGVITKKAIKSEKVYDPVMDDYINAKTRPGLGCYRKVLQIFYDLKEQVDDHIKCRPDLLPSGCVRCSPRVSRICCDGCNLSKIEEFFYPLMSVARENTQQPAPSIPSRSRIPRYDAEPNDIRLSNLLYSWRDKRAAEVLQQALFVDYGPNLFIPDHVIDRIVDCAHSLTSKFNTAEDIRRETQSRKAEKYSEEIFAIIKSVRPQPSVSSPFTTAPKRPPLQSRTLNGISQNNIDSNSGSSSNAPKQPIRCGKCRQLGHSARSAACAMNKKSQNTPPH